MAKTKPTKPRGDRQAPAGVWSPKELLDGVRRPSREEKIRMLREVGIIDAKRGLAKKYRSCGARVSRTEAD